MFHEGKSWTVTDCVLIHPVSILLIVFYPLDVLDPPLPSGAYSTCGGVRPVRGCSMFRRSYTDGSLRLREGMSSGHGLWRQVPMHVWYVCVTTTTSAWYLFVCSFHTQVVCGRTQYYLRSFQFTATNCARVIRWPPFIPPVFVLYLQQWWVVRASPQA